jgi:tRNA(Ile)-lysidine synthase
MNREYYHRVKQFCETNHIFQQGEHVAVGFSGGGDSVYLVLMLLELARPFDLTLWLVHVNHGIRGEEADRDQAFCEKFAREKSLPILLFRGDVPSMAREQKRSLEEAARQFRYDCFQEALEKQGLDKIAVAHHQDDQAETILFQMMRGSGLGGLGGMKAVTGNLVRPLLPLRHREIRQDLEAMGQAWCEDSTNQETEYSRNRIRHQVMPLLEESVNSSATEHIARCGQQFQWIQQFLNEELDKRMGELSLQTTSQGRLTVSVQGLLGLPRALQMEMAHRLFVMQAGKSRDITFSHLEALLALAQGETGKRLDLPYDIKAGKDYDTVWLQHAPDVSGTEGLQTSFLWEKTRTETLEIKVPAMAEKELVVTLSGADDNECFSLQKGKIPKKICTKWFDYDKINSTLEIRHPQTGDFLWLDAEKTKRKSLSRLMIDSHIPREQRERIWVMAEGSSIVWIPELGRQSVAYYVSDETNKLLIGKVVSV